MSPKRYIQNGGTHQAGTAPKALSWHDSNVLGSNSNDYAVGILHLGGDTRPEVPSGIFKHEFKSGICHRADSFRGKQLKSEELGYPRF
jgi:hypothetical protein